MTDAVQLAIIAATPPTLVSFVAAWLGWLNHEKIARVDGCVTQVGNAVTKVGVEINGRMSQFLATKDELTERRVEGSYKQGVADQKENG